MPFRENPRIVRGLDYYGHTAFEFVTSKLGAQGTVHAGQEGFLGQPPLGGPAAEQPDYVVTVLIGGAEYLRKRVRGHHDPTITPRGRAAP